MTKLSFSQENVITIATIVLAVGVHVGTGYYMVDKVEAAKIASETIAKEAYPLVNGAKLEEKFVSMGATLARIENKLDYLLDLKKELSAGDISKMDTVSAHCSHSVPGDLCTKHHNNC